MKKPLVFLIDLDNTLLDNDKVKSEIKKSLIHVLGPLEAKHFWDHHDDIRTKTNLVDFPKAIREYCAEKDAETCDIRLGKIFDAIDFQKALYPDVYKVLEHLKSKGYVALFTEGDLVYQKKKIEKSGVGALVDRVFHFKHKLKHFEEIKKEFSHSHLIVVDDRSETLMKLKSKHPDITIVEVCQGHYSDVDHKDHPTLDKTIESISDLLHIPITN